MLTGVFCGCGCFVVTDVSIIVVFCVHRLVGIVVVCGYCCVL